MADLAIKTHALKRLFGKLTAVDGVDLEVDAGEVYGFLGPNGAGKTTCVRMLCTLLKPSGGSAVVAGYDVERDPHGARLKIGVALQEAALDEKQTGFELLRLQARLYGLRGCEVKDRIEKMAKLTGLGDALGRLVGTYSGGMKRRLDLAAALIHNPEVLFLDEPTTGLDPISRKRVWDEVRRVNRDLGTTIFLTTQYLEEADALANRVGIINEGLIVAEGTPADLKRSIGSDVICAGVDGDAAAARAPLESLPEVESVETFEGEVTVHVADGAAAMTPVAVALDSSGLKVRHLTLRTPTLDDVFLEKTGARMREEEVV